MARAGPQPCPKPRSGHAPTPWDLAAGWLVVTEAGGWVGGITKDFADHSMTVAGGAVAAELRALLSSVLATVGDEDAEV